MFVNCDILKQHVETIRINDVRLHQNQLEYLVIWKNFHENSWEMLEDCFYVSNLFHQYYENHFDNIVESHWRIFLKIDNNSSVVDDTSTHFDNIDDNSNYEIYVTTSYNDYKNENESVVSSSLFLEDFLKENNFIFFEQSYYAHSLKDRCSIESLLATKFENENAIAIDNDLAKKRKRSLISYDRINRARNLETILVYEIKQFKKRSSQQREFDWLI